MEYEAQLPLVQSKVSIGLSFILQLAFLLSKYLKIAQVRIGLPVDHDPAGLDDVSPMGYG